MDAVILAGGRGERLRPVTDYIPKPLVPICNIPILEWQITYLERYDIKRIILCSGYKSEMLLDFVERRKFKVDLVLSDESYPLGTGGALKNAASLISSNDVIVMNGDIITDIDLGKMYHTSNSLAAIPLRTKFGVLDISGDVISGFREKMHLDDIWMNAGIYCLGSDMLDELPEKGDLEKTTFPEYAKNGLLYAVKHADAKWYSIDSFKDVDECSTVIHDMMK